jgi:guanine deaminase
MEQAFRAAVLWFEDAGGVPTLRWEDDGLLVVGPGLAPDAAQRVIAVGAWSALSLVYEHLPVTYWPGRLMVPGFVDLHIHYPQTDVIGSPAEGLLSWLENHTFVHESRFHDPAHATQVAEVFLDELLRHGVTTALTFATSHPASVDALMHAGQTRGIKLVAGKVLQDRHSPDGVRDETDQSLIDTEQLIQRWHGQGRLGYAITPRFAPSCSDAQMRGAAELAGRYPDVWIQSHVAENVDEVRWVQSLYPSARSYLDVYASLGLLRERAVYAHCIHLDETDRMLMRESGAVAAFSPTSNLFLGSGFFDVHSAERVGFRYGLASDVGGGTSFCPFHTMLAAYCVGRASVTGGGLPKTGVSLPPSRLWWLHTAGAAQAMGLGGIVGNLTPGCEADFVVINPQAKPLLARRWAQAASREEALFALIVMGDDRVIEHVHVAG